jgi:hypothetical protein
MLQERYEVNRRARKVPRTEESADSEAEPADPEQGAFAF